jgi:nitrate/nitrite-specific signal transduction histidine kinase
MPTKVTVRDDGRGMCRRGNSPGLGLGMSLIGQVSDELAVQPNEGGGTELRIGFRRREPLATGQPVGRAETVSGLDETRVPAGRT